MRELKHENDPTLCQIEVVYTILWVKVIFNFVLKTENFQLSLKQE